METYFAIAFPVLAKHQVFSEEMGGETHYCTELAV